ncbi:unnamed protein product [Cuscuta campestris]|uniref:Uncharacterized protein n=1 Tax=Cuscuta campestris TaxID=132261 RepID=A0A484KXN0_9ASTE|nr:unnamed protein product [Cuscuta campestris]
MKTSTSSGDHDSGELWRARGWSRRRTASEPASPSGSALTMTNQVPLAIPAVRQLLATAGQRRGSSLFRRTTPIIPATSLHVPAIPGSGGNLGSRNGSGNGMNLFRQ